MTRSWTLGQKLGTGLGVIVTLAVIIALVAIAAFRSISQTNHDVVAHAHDVHGADLLRSKFERKAGVSRAYLLTRDRKYLEHVQRTRAEFDEVLRQLERTNTDPERGRLLREFERLEREHQVTLERIQDLPEGNISAVAREFEEQLRPRYDATVVALDALLERSDDLLDLEHDKLGARARTSTTLVGAIAAAALVAAILLAALLTRALSRQIGLAVQHLQSSSAELEASSKQQAATSKQQATTTNEVTSTVRELLATSRQIAESAQRVVRIAEQTLAAAQGGDSTMQRAQEGIMGIKRQVDAIVRHMLDLGRKSQEIGAILEIINELSEQTNILAINATIEAAGAGESGRRFAVVADEIRKLADRVGASTKDIRRLIDEIRAAANTTVMVTEQGSKAVDAGTRQFIDVTASFKQIGELVGSTTDAAREIELSTRQQTTAVEQVNVAILDLTHSATELEASSRQTVQIAGELAALSQDLARVVSPSNGSLA